MELTTPSPQTRSGHDFSTSPLRGAPKIEYKAGKLETASVKMYFAGKMDAEYLTQGFSYYDQEQKVRVALPSFTAYVLGVYYGSFSDGGQKGDIRYISNLVNDTRTDVVQCSYFVDGQRQTLAVGNYKTAIAPKFLEMGRKSSYTKVIVAYVAEMKQVCAFHLNATAEAGFLKAIATARNIKEYSANLFGMSEKADEVWVFQYAGESEPVVFAPSDARNMPPTVPATGDAHTLFFQPVFSNAGVITTGTHPEKVASVRAMTNELSDYIASEQLFFKGQIGEKESAPQPAPETAYSPANDYFAARSFTPSHTAPAANGFENLVEPLGAITDLGVGEDGLDLPF